MTDEIQLLRELGGEIPADQGVVRDIYERATRSERRLRRLAQPRYAVALVAVTLAAAIALSIAVANLGASHDHPPPINGAKPRPNVWVSTVDEADALLPFEAVLPSNVVPTGRGILISAEGKAPGASGAMNADIDTTDAGSYLLSEESSNATVETLQHWAAQSAAICSNCAQQVVTQDGVHVLVLVSPVFGLRLQWVRGDGASPVLTELDWRPDMPANNVIPRQDAALAIADDFIRQGG